MSKLNAFLQESKKEFKRVNWPTTRETIRLTLIVIAMSLLVSALLGVFDFVFLMGLETIL